jgi:hypothetical protein
VNLLTDLEQKT